MGRFASICDSVLFVMGSTGWQEEPGPEFLGVGTDRQLGCRVPRAKVRAGDHARDTGRSQGTSCPSLPGVARPWASQASSPEASRRQCHPSEGILLSL